MFLWIYPSSGVWRSHIEGIIQRVAFFLWLLMRSITLSRSLQMAVCLRASFLLTTEKYSTAFIYDLSIHASAVGRLVVSTIWLLRTALLWTRRRVSLFESLFSAVRSIDPNGELLAHLVIPCLTFCRTTRLFSMMAAPSHIPTSNGQGFPFLSVLAIPCNFPSLKR